ncbi:hypothetical protein AB0387_26455 [Streptomyces sp. NPDC089173]|uniref:hypothetical protein n=1 Tax=Streptomyces sp. NPDC089173 TaxID=3154965 RepID=UPI00344E7805
MICARCDQPLAPEAAVRLDRSDSMSGARPDDHAHRVGAEECRPYPATLTPLQAAILRTTR